MALKAASSSSATVRPHRGAVAREPDQGLEIALPELLGGIGVPGLEGGDPDSDGASISPAMRYSPGCGPCAARDDVIPRHFNATATTCLNRFLPAGWHFPAMDVDEDVVGRTRRALKSGRVEGHPQLRVPHPVLSRGQPATRPRRRSRCVHTSACWHRCRPSIASQSLISTPVIFFPRPRAGPRGRVC